MRLLEVQQDGALSLTENLHEDDSIPAYAILSHTWQAGEVTFDEFKNGTGNQKAGYEKIRLSTQQAQRDGLCYVWVDTCCINKADAVELQHAINSMFRWYRDAARCYVFLSDVSSPDMESVITAGAPLWEQAFRSSRWFIRGWTLQELLAPRAVSFFSQEWKHLGERHELKHRISEITGIPVSALGDASLDSFSVDERLSWSSRRQTTHKEDRAYSLLGMFNVFMPLLYGEGEENAFRRLKKGIEEKLQDIQPRENEEPAKQSADRNFSEGILMLRSDSIFLQGRLLVRADVQSFLTEALSCSGHVRVILHGLPGVGWAKFLCLEFSDRANFMC